MAPLIEAIRAVSPNSIGATKALVVIPLGMLPKRIMVGLELISDIGNPVLLTRRGTALRQVALLASLASDVGVVVTDELRSVLEAICEFSPGYWQRYLRHSRHSFERPQLALRRYLQDGTSLYFKREDLERWANTAEAIGARLRQSVGASYNPNSSTENALLVAPALAAMDIIRTLEDVDLYLHVLLRFVEQAEAGSALLQQLWEYGHRTEVLVQCRVPLNEPSTLSMAHDVPFRLRLGGRTEIDAEFGDTNENTVIVRISDPDVTVRLRDIVEPDAGRWFRNYNSLRESEEDLAVTSWELPRPDWIRVRLTLAPSRLARLIVGSFVGLIVAVRVAVVLLDRKTSGDLAVFVVPTTLAAGIVLVQQRTSLSAQLQRGWQSLVIIAIGILWGVVMLAYFRGWITP